MWSACGTCRYCLAGMETICKSGEATGYTKPGGYAEYMLAKANFVAKLPKPVQVLQDRRGRAALIRVGGDHSRKEDPRHLPEPPRRRPHGSASSSSRVSTLSESKYSSARRRAARACRG